MTPMTAFDTPSAGLIRVELGAALRPFTRHSSPLFAALSRAMKAMVYQTCQGYGIAGSPFVEIGETAADEMIRVVAAERVRCASAALFFRLRDPAVPLQHPVPRSAWDAVGEEPESAIPAIVAAVSEILHREPDLLLGPATSPRTPSGADSSNTGLVQFLMALGVSLRGLRREQWWLEESLLGGASEADVAEGLFARLRSPFVDVCMPADDAREIFGLRNPGESFALESGAAPERVRRTFGRLADRLYYDLGVRVPPFRWIRGEWNAGPRFCVGLGAYQSPPLRSLPPGFRFTNDPLKSLKLAGIDTWPFPDPAGGNPGACFSERFEMVVASAGLTVLDPLDYLSLAVERELRRNAWRLLDVELVEHELALARDNFPELVRTALGKVTPEHLTRVLRELLRWGTPVRDLRSLLESVCCFDMVYADTLQKIVFDSRLAIDSAFSGLPVGAADYAQHVRNGLRRAISYKHSYEGGTVPVLLLDAGQIERPILDHVAARTALPPQFLSKFKLLLWEELSTSASQRPTPLLTISGVAIFLRRALALDFPDLPVLAYSELSPEARVRVMGRLSLDQPDQP